MKKTENRVLFIFYLLIRLGLIALGILLLAQDRTGSALLCLLTLALTFIPFLLRKILRLFIPLGLELTIVLFSLAANIFGEVFEFYLKLPLWDLGLHIIWGFVGGAVGCGLMRMLRGRTETSPLFTAVFCLCLSLSTALLWEFFEYFVDSVFLMDMQKDCYIDRLSSVLLNPEGQNLAVTINIEEVTVNGASWPGYIDTGLKDTMEDLLINSLGALGFSLCIILSKMKGRLWRFLEQLIPSRLDSSRRNDIE
jgi:hypothetical protein